MVNFSTKIISSFSNIPKLRQSNVMFTFHYLAPNFIYSEIYRCERGSYFTKISRIVKTFANKTDCSLYSKSRSGYKVYEVMKFDDIGTIKIHVNYTVLSWKGQLQNRCAYNDNISGSLG